MMEGNHDMFQISSLIMKLESIVMNLRQSTEARNGCLMFKMFQSVSRKRRTLKKVIIIVFSDKLSSEASFVGLKGLN